MLSTEDWVQMMAPAVTSAGGALLAVKIMYGRIREDIADLFKKIEHLEEEFVGQTVQNAREHGEVTKHIGVLQERVENLSKQRTR